MKTGLQRLKMIRRKGLTSFW